LHSGYTFRTRAILKAQQAQGWQVRGITGLRHRAAGADEELVEGLAFARTQGVARGPAGLREWREVCVLADAIKALARDWQPHIMHAHSPALCGLAALRAARRLNLPVICEIRAFWEDAAAGNGTRVEDSLKYRLTRALENHVVARADRVVTICRGLHDDLRARGVPHAKLSIVPNGVDMALFGTPGQRDPDLAAELGLGDGPVIGFIGSFYDYEGLDVLIAAMPALAKRYPEARLLLVGGGPMADRLKAQAQASPATAAIRLVGRVPHDQVDRYYALADIMVYPRKASRLTDLVTPLKPLEAMAQGKLVAASDVGGHRELVTHGVTGTLFAADDPAACAAALCDLIERKERWPEIRAAARNHVELQHDWSRNVQRYQDVYQSLLGLAIHGCRTATCAQAGANGMA
ncbi:MAG: glycosyltransferase, exosortase A system-associated, partial [Alteraurantiacibacter sp.]|nr:glycosyltransferase, exosortase A system-associated [Alteraurantiacibacter sp.]